MIGDILSFLLGRMDIWTPLAALGLALVSAHRVSGLKEKDVLVDRVLAYWLLFTAGVQGLDGFVMHAFFPDFTAGLIGWSPSPFQREVAFADAAVGVLGVAAFFYRSAPFRLAAALVFFICFFGDGIGHVIEMRAGNMAEYNTGALLAADLLYPAVAVLLVAAQFRLGVPARRPG